jgi:hypothetical protein
MRTSTQHKDHAADAGPPRASELLQPLIHLWPADRRSEVAAVTDYLYRIASERPEIIERLAPMRDASAMGNVRAAAIAQPELFAQEFSVMRRILLEALQTEGSGEWGRVYLIMNFPALLLQRIHLRIRPLAAKPLSPFVYAMQ